MRAATETGDESPYYKPGGFGVGFEAGGTKCGTKGIGAPGTPYMAGVRGWVGVRRAVGGGRVVGFVGGMDSHPHYVQRL